jgi:hypothetical protein
VFAFIHRISIMGNLAYDDNAAAVFGVTLLLFFLVPAIWSVTARLCSFYRLCGCGAAKAGDAGAGAARARTKAEEAKLRVFTRAAERPDVLMTPRFQVRSSFVVAARGGSARVDRNSSRQWAARCLRDHAHDFVRAARA